MKIKIFDVDAGGVLPSENCYIVPELKAIIDAYEDPIPALSFLYGMTDPSSPYVNYPEADKEEIIWADFPGDYTTEDDEMIAALNKLKELYSTPVTRLYRSAKIGLEKLGKYLETTQIEGGRDGNLAAYSTALTRMGKTAEDLKKIEKMVDAEQDEYTTRGGQLEPLD